MKAIIVSKDGNSHVNIAGGIDILYKDEETGQLVLLAADNCTEMRVDAKDWHRILLTKTEEEQ